MYEILFNVFIITGAIICAMGACLLGVFAFMILSEIVLDKYDSFRLNMMKRKFNEEKKLYLMNQLDELKERYPDLEINYKIK